MQSLIREVYLGRVERGKADFRVTLIIEINPREVNGDKPISFYIRYGGREYPLSRSVGWLINGSIRPVDEAMAKAMCSIYLLHEVYLSFRSQHYDYNQNLGLAIREIRDRKRYDLTDIPAVLRQEGLGERQLPAVPPELPDSTIKWLTNLPGTGCSFEDVEKAIASMTVSEEEYMKIISTAG